MTSKRFFGFLVGALSLFILYYVVALRQHNFEMPGSEYLPNFRDFLYGIPRQVLESQLWKIVLLFPATVLFSLALTRAGFQYPSPEKLNYRLFIGAVTISIAVILVLSTQFLFHETEVTDDEIVYDFQAKTLMAGRIVNPPPPIPGRSMNDPLSGETSFDNTFIINDGHQWVGKYTLGHPAIIALGMMLGNRYIVIIGISVLTLLLIYLIAQELYNDRKIALLAFCLGSVSPFFYFVSSSRLSHTTSAFCLALFMYLFLRLRRTRLWRQQAVTAFLAGLILGYAFNVRSLTALGFALPFVVVWAMDGRRFPRETFMTGLLMLAGFSLVLASTLWYNSVVTGNWLRFPFNYYNSWESIGFDAQHTPYSALHNLAVTIVRMNGALFGFPLSLLFVFVYSLAKKESGDWLLFGILGSFACAYCFYYSPGVQALGPVYYYETLVPLSILSARGILFLHRTISDRFEGGKTFMLHFLVTSCIVALSTFVPERVVHIARLTDLVRKPYETVRSANIHHALIFIRSWAIRGHVEGYRSPSPAFDDDIVYCRYADSVSNHALLNYFPNRAPYLMQYDKANDLMEILSLDRNTMQPSRPETIDGKKN